MTAFADWFLAPSHIPQGVVWMVATPSILGAAKWIVAILYGLLKVMTE